MQAGTRSASQRVSVPPGQLQLGSGEVISSEGGTDFPPVKKLQTLPVEETTPPLSKRARRRARQRRALAKKLANEQPGAPGKTHF